jgi:L-2,4-diaminobutyrate decarboxylase
MSIVREVKPEKYLSATTKLHHPSYLAHQVAPSHYAGSLGAMIDGFTNNAMAIYEMGPAASAIEYFLINWFLEKVGWQPSPLTLEDEKKDEQKVIFICPPHYLIM